MSLTFVLGTRPEVIKLSPLILEARRRGHSTQVVFSGQHREIAIPLLEFFEIEPDLDLNVMTENQSLSGLSAKVLVSLDEQHQIAPDYLIVQGDTTTAFIAAYWAFCRRIPVAHVEAGLRTYDLSAPFPEEANRQLIGRIASLHFASTPKAAAALASEGVDPSSIEMVGNTGIDALEIVLGRLRDKASGYGLHTEPDRRIVNFIGKNKLVLVTAHRRESFGVPIENICRGILSVAHLRHDIRVVYPVHPNPNIRDVVKKHLGNHERILLCDPLPYLEFTDLMSRASVLLTDSGGIQEEGPTLRIPVLVMRDTTERPDGIEAGYSRLVGTDPEVIASGVFCALSEGCRGRGPNPYGDGKSAARIITRLESSVRRTPEASPDPLAN